MTPKTLIVIIAALIAVGSIAYVAGTGNLKLSWKATAPETIPSVTLQPSSKASTKPVTSPAASLAPAPSTATTGIITGALGYPSEGIPKDMKVCAENQATKTETCTNQQITINAPQPHPGYSLTVPAGNYFVYANVPSADPKYRAYYNVFVTCGLKFECKDHTPLVVSVKAGQTVTGVDPQDWYNQ